MHRVMEELQVLTVLTEVVESRASPASRERTATQVTLECRVTRVTLAPLETPERLETGEWRATLEQSGPQVPKALMADPECPEVWASREVWDRLEPPDLEDLPVFPVWM